MPRKDMKARAEYGRAYYILTKESRRAARRKLGREQKRRLRERDPNKATEVNRLNKLKRKGLTLKQFEEWLAMQNGRCAICSDPMSPPYVDHDHAHCGKGKACGKCVRGLLCRRCNLGLGYFRDNPTFLRGAAFYLLNPIPKPASMPVCP
jgi:hypothetical protein